MEVYQLLCQLRNWELDPRRVPAAFRNAWDEEVSEVFDLIKDEDERAGSACIDVDEYIADVPHKTSSGFTPPHTPSSQQVRRISPYDKHTDACDQIFTESPSNTSNCQDDAPATTIYDCHQQSPSFKAAYVLAEPLFQVQITHCGIEELEAYAYAVIETVSHESVFTFTSDGVHTTVIEEPKNEAITTPERMLSPCAPRREVDEKGRMIVKQNNNNNKKSTSFASAETNLDELRKEDSIRRPQFRSSEDRLSFTQHMMAGAPAYGLLSFGRSRTAGTAYTFSEYDHLLSTINVTPRHIETPPIQGSMAMPDCCNYAGGVTLQHEIYVPPENTRPRLFASPRPISIVDPILHPKILSPKLEADTYIFGAQPSSPSNEPWVSQVVTPEAGRQKPCKLKKRQQKSHVDENPVRKLHFPNRVSTFVVTDFGFPSTQSITLFLSRGACSSVQCVRKGRGRYSKIKTKGTPRQRNHFDCCLINRSGDLHHGRSALNSITFSVIPASRLLAKQLKPIKAECLREQWNIQSTLRRSDQRTPSGHLTGRWKPPQWAVGQSHGTSDDSMGVNIQKEKKYPGCRMSLLPELDSLVLNFSAEMRISCNYSGQNHTSASLRDVVCPQYVRPTINLLCSAHSAVESLLPKGDCEDWEVVAMAWRYYNHWRPRETKVIFLAESHAFTPKVSSLFIFCPLHCVEVR